MVQKKKKKKTVLKKKPSKKKVLRKKPVKRAKKPLKAKKPVKKAKKKAAKKGAIKKRQPKFKENVIGVITHYFPKVRAAVVKLQAPLSVGDTVKIKGHTTDFTQNINSMQIDRTPITAGKKGDEIGLLVDSRVRQHDLVVKP